MMSAAMCRTLVIFLCCASFAAAQGPETVSVSFDADTVRILNIGAYENCGCEFKVDVQVSPSTITVVECDTNRDKALCMCNFDFEAKVAGLAPGSYTAEVYRQYWKKFMYPFDTLMRIGSVTFTVSAPEGPMAASGKAGACYHIQDVASIPVPDRKELTIVLDGKSGTARIGFEIGKAGKAELLLYDAAGRMVVRIHDGELAVGKYNMTADLSGFPSGIYYPVLRDVQGVKTGRIALLR